MSGIPYGRRGKGALKARMNKTTSHAPDEIVKEYESSTPVSHLIPIVQTFEGPTASPVEEKIQQVKLVDTSDTIKRVRAPLIKYDAPESTIRTPYVSANARASITHIETLSKKLATYEKEQKESEQTNPYLTDTTIYMPSTRRAFYKFIRNTYEEKFGLELHLSDEKIDMEACSKLGLVGTQRVESFLYQKFIREYIRQASPYRGILVYHGLGSGKTCSAIAAAESLYGVANKRIIVMTPFSLRQNFINEISFCGFRHFQTNNHWVSQSLEHPKYSTTLRLYAKTVLSMSDKYISSILKREPATRRVIWMPVFTEAVPNYKELDGQSQNDIRNQIQETINNRITFINYNGITANKLKEYACTRDVAGNTIFDNAVIVIDEFHNLTRLMQGSIVPYLIRREGLRRKIPPEPVTPEDWKPKLCGKPMNYKRAFLFYRLLCGAKDSKIIALSGTPIINFPEELAIIANVLAGYTDCVETVLHTADVEVAREFVNIARDELRVDIVRVQAGTGLHRILISVFPVGYLKVMDGTEFIGVRRAGEEERGEAVKSIAEVYARIKQIAKGRAIPVADTETFISYPRLPPDGDTFRRTFINERTLGIENSIVLKKRLTGLISYYKGSKEEYMPRVIRNDIVACKMSDYVLSKYAEARKREMDIEKNKKDGDSGDIFADVEYFSKKKNPSSYKFRSRAICNFAFPKGIVRPFPGSVDDYIDIELLDVDAADTDEDRMVESVVEKEDAEIEGPEEGDAGVLVSAAPEPAKIKSYQDDIRRALYELDMHKNTLLKLDAELPEQRLENYSPKMAQMLRNIINSQGSNLLYSQFKTVEGLGVMGIAMRANGFVEIVIEGTDANPYFSIETETSLRKGPTGGDKRFIFFTGEGSKERRTLILNIFNGYFDKLPVKMRTPFIESGYSDIRNMHGEICWVIGLTGAGAEGISLKNVRGVHIMEPYWNMVRLDQVKGRAIRICSHADLPFKDREVEIYTYYTVFSEDQIKNKKIDQTIVNIDKVETSDQKVLNVSMRKQKMNEELLTVMKEAAIDCTLNLPDNGDVRCFNIIGSSGQYMFDPNLDVDKLVTQTEFIEKREDVDISSMDVIAKETGHIGVSTREEQFQVVEIENSSGNLEKYMMKPEGHNRYVLFGLRDTRMAEPVGEIMIDPVSGEFMEPVIY